MCGTNNFFQKANSMMLVEEISFFFFFFFNYYYFISTTSIDIHCSSTYSNIKITKKSYKIFDFKSRDSTFYKAIEKRGHVSSMQLICMTKQKKTTNIVTKTERYETKINK